MGLTLEEANRILRGTLAKAQELNIKISAAICDPGGRPIALQRMDNTMWASAYAAQGTTSSNPPSSSEESATNHSRGGGWRSPHARGRGGVSSSPTPWSRRHSACV